MLLKEFASEIIYLIKNRWMYFHVVVGRPPDCIKFATAVAIVLTNLSMSAVDLISSEERKGDIKQPKVEFSPFYAGQIRGREVILIEDVAMTLATLKEMARAIREAGGNLLGGVVVCNRAGDIEEELGVPFLSLINVSEDENWQSWPQEECPLCAKGVPLEWKVDDEKGFLVPATR